MPEVGGERRVDSRKNGDEVVLVSADSAFGRVGAVLLGRDILDREFVEGEQGRQVGRSLVVEREVGERVAVGTEKGNN